MMSSQFEAPLCIVQNQLHAGYEQSLSLVHGSMPSVSVCIIAKQLCLQPTTACLMYRENQLTCMLLFRHCRRTKYS